MWPNPQETADLVTFTEEILNGKLHFLCSVRVFFLIYQSANGTFSIMIDTLEFSFLLHEKLKFKINFKLHGF